MSLKHEFNYGWCYTDKKKNGRNFWGISRYYEYSYSPQFHETAKQLFEDLAIPMPKKEEFFHGTYNDLVFIDSHGIVVRLGPSRIGSLINPLIIQPIGWQSLKGITASVYPGIEIAEQIYPYETYPRDSKLCYHEKIQEFAYKMKETGSILSDGFSCNMGVIRITDSEGEENKDTLVILDTDYQTLSSTREMSEKRDVSLETNNKNFNNPADIMATTIYDLYGNIDAVSDNIKAFEKHQSLRREFWNAVNSDKSKEKLGVLWDKCASHLNSPQSATFPVWKRVNDVYVREDITVKDMVLYNNWRIKPPEPVKHTVTPKL